MSEERGIFIDMVDRNVKQIKTARAEDIKARAQMEYKRKVEDAKYDLDSRLRLLDAKMDMSPDNTFAIIKSDSFDAKEFAIMDGEDLVEIRELTIKFNMVNARYTRLFGEKIYEAVQVEGY